MTPRPLQPHHTRVIGLTGPAGSGKDTVAALLRTHVAAHTIAFADALRAEVSDAFSIEPMYLTRRETKEHPISALSLARSLDPAFVGRMIMLNQQTSNTLLDLDAPRSPRQLMQWWGTEYRRAQDPDYWVRKAADRIHWLHTELYASLVVITDVRFDNECQLVRSLGGQLWQIKRPGCYVAPSAHVSEVTGEGFTPNLVINNSHDMRHLQQLVLGGWAERAWGVPGVRVEVPA